MKLQVTLEKSETIEQAEEVLEKALKAKHDCSGGERYLDPAMNEFHDHVESKHSQLVDSILKDIAAELERDVHSRV